MVTILLSPEAHVGHGHIEAEIAFKVPVRVSAWVNGQSEPVWGDSTEHNSQPPAKSVCSKSSSPVRTPDGEGRVYIELVGDAVFVEPSHE